MVRRPRPKCLRRLVAETSPLCRATASIGRSVVSSSRWRVLQPLPQQPLVGRRTGARGEPPGERPPAHRRPSGQIGHADRFVEVLLCPGDGVGEQVRRVELRHRRVDVLGLTSVAVRRDDQVAGHPGGGHGPVVAADQVQAEVDGGRAARRGQDVAVVDVEHVGVDGEGRIPGGQLGALGPVRGDPPPVQQPGRGQHEGSGAQRHQARAAGVRLAQRRQHGRGRPVRCPARRHQHGVRPQHLLQAVRDLHAQPVVEGHRSRSTDHQAVPGLVGAGREVGAEDLGGHRQPEWVHPVVHDEGDGVRRCGVGRFGAHAVR